ncbi:DUF637 domain-containing protein [Pectobacterium aroidearum]|uniref:DUF637 domain-containing protein n=1 Tax=Pectobacterium aroidearum TaxID=1201031 RepID=UPI002114A6CD|nr:DUF637 domain-containing protein [Pectobacterium aroidearum]UUE57800.1 DUF637 domain-containing protein [Pectobacterium aroidearum]UUE70505.1 DUF637 domain-containing protein [Pectobacterium aroidearum]UUE74883.1 DUF637 domain-containing protein [Pectobacterium aroidearum]UUE79213.1 DUF637 domain-containing protein [Pectobacterium aroidearum]
MEKFNNRATRGLSYLLIYLTAIQPLHPAFAALTPDGPRTQVNNAGAVPVINIATPNAAGVSHNTYKDFSVGTPGAVLNNSIAAGQSQLAGQLNANANLNGKAAELIINEVTGSTRSDLQGKVEVFGNKANVLIANPNGITCDGCGFINTPSATLTTGKPVLDQQGALEALEVKKGSITIGGKGLDGSATDYVDILSRATELNGKINAKSLTLTQGSNRVDFKTGTIAPIAGEGAKPLLAVDTKALGGMYAERIRLVATEDGVGANVANLTSSQQGITLDSKGKIQLGNVHAKTDLNLTAQQVDIAAGNTVKSDRDITLASTTLNNQGNIVAGQDMRLFNDSLTNTQATIEANNNLWIQKDAAGNKGVKVENRSGTIKTNTGDLVVRTGSLKNVRDKIVVKEKKDLTYANLNIGNELPIRSISDAKAYIPSIAKKEVEGEFTTLTPEAEIHGEKNLYINATQLENNASSLRSFGNIFLTGQTFLNISPLFKQTEHTTNFRSETAQEQAVRRSNTSQSASTTILDDGTPLILAYYRVKDKESEFKGEQLLSAKVQATGNVIADFGRLIKIENTLQPQSPTAMSLDTINIKGNDVLLSAGDIKINGIIESSNNANLISKNSVIIDQSIFSSSSNDINISATSTIGSTTSFFRARNINLNSREGDIVYATTSLPIFNNPGNRLYASLHAEDTLSLNAGGNIKLSGVNFRNNKNTVFVAGKDLTIINSIYDLITHQRGIETTPENNKRIFDDAFFKLNYLFTDYNILAKAKGNITLSGVSLTAGKGIDLIANGMVIIDVKTVGNIYNEFLPSTRTPSLSSRLSTGDLLINSGGEINIKSANLSANNITLLAGNTISLLSTAYSAITTPDEENKDDRHVITQINARRNLTLATNGALIASGSSLSSIGDMTLSSLGKMEFNALKNYSMREGNNEFNESTTQQNVVLNSGGVLTLLSSSSILFQATSLVAKGAMDVAAKGGFLYAQAMEETNHYEQESSSHTWYGKKKKGKQTYHNVSNKVTEFTAGSDINLLSRDDSIYEASKIEAGKNAKLTSTQGKVIFKAVKNTTFEQTITSSKGFFIKNSDRGYTKDTWLLPSIHAGGQFTVDAATGISADVKTRNAQSLQNALLTLSNTPGATWLKGLNTRKDVQWNAVQDAYTNWNHTTQSLNPVVGAVIAIAVAAVTAGTGLAAAAGQLAAGAVGTGASATTIAVVNGAVYSGMTALTSQAAVALVDNKGNLTKTMQTLGNSASVKSLITSMAIGGALAGFDSVLKVSNTGASPTQTKLPILSNGDWNKVAQRIAGQSVISSSIGTAINGGSFKDNFTTALLSNIGSQINAEGAKFIGDKGEVLGLPIDDPRRVISHAVIAGVAAEIGGGNAKGAAAGALAAELAAISLGNTFVDPALREIQITSTGRIIGALAGAAITGKVSGVNSGANAAESVLLYNFLMHDEPARMAKKLADCKGNGECEVDIRKEITRLSAQNENKFESCRVAGNGDCINEMLSGISEASGFRELGLQIGFDIAGQYQQMGENAYDRFDTCGWNVGTGCALKLWGKEAVTEAVLLGAGWGVAKFAGPAIGKYLTEVGVLSQKGALANIKSAQIGLKNPELVDNLKNQMKNSDFNFSKMENRVGGYVDKNGKYFLQEGNHRMVAAKELYQETGNSTYIENLIKNGRWTYTEKYIGDIYSLPVRKK